MTADTLPTVPIHQLGQYAVPRIPRPEDEPPVESDNNNDKILNSHEQMLKDLSDPKKV